MTPKTISKRWLIIGTALFIFVAAGFVLPVVRSGSNCGGNSAALAACKGYIFIVQIWATEHGNQAFQYGQADAMTQKELNHLPGSRWLGSARLLTKTNDVRINATAGKQVILVCDRAYDNVPRQFWGRSPMTHAVAYATGETGLISPEEFSRLDLTGFTNLQTATQE